MPKLDPVLSEEKRQYILRCARDVFAQKGYQGATIKDITRRARISNGALFVYFDRKKDILIEVISQDMDIFRQRIKTFTAHSENYEFTEIVEHLLELVRQIAVGSGGAMFLDVWSAALHDEEIKEVLVRSRQITFQVMEQLFIKFSEKEKWPQHTNLNRLRDGLYGFMIPGYIFQLLMIGPMEPKAYMSAYRSVWVIKKAP